MNVDFGVAAGWEKGKWGEVVLVVGGLKPGAALPEEEIIGFCRQRIAHYKCPASVEVIVELPRNASGKVLKRVLREKHWEGHDRGVS